MMICSICLFICVVDLCARLNPSTQVRFALRALGEATFGVFLVHLLVIAVIRVMLPDFYADPAPVAKTLMYVVVVAFSFLISLIARRTPVLRRIF
jgi:surface polysaccharide O-acyltransferase-like enzyme